MERIVNGVLKFQREVYPNSKALFRELSMSQAPAALFIGCADSRVVPEMLTQQGPGDLFVVRNAGNIVPPYGPEPGGVTASIEYAVSVLGVPDVVICGHSGCGAMTALMNGRDKLENLPAVAKWLHYADNARKVLEENPSLPPEKQLDALVHKNVLAQLANLLTHPVVAKAVQAKQVRVHGWVYEIGTGAVSTYDAQTSQFVPLSSAPFASATPQESVR
jgi:carbonic anhydrase